MVLRHEEVEVAIPAEVGKARAGVSIIYLDHQIFVWVGDKAKPALENMHYAMMSLGAAGGGGGQNSSVATLMGNRVDGVGERVGRRLCSKLGIAVVCAWNVKTPFPQDEVDLLANLVCKKVSELWLSRKSVK